MTHGYSTARLLQKAYQLVISAVCIMAFSLGLQSVFTIATPAAKAMTLDTQLVAYDMVEYERQNAQEQIDRVFGSGTGKQLGGQVEQAVGKVQRELGKSSGEVEGTTRQVEGRAKQDLGRTQNALERAG
jgi:uncharacterized protein YjbJ (UPF0337 family)